MLYKGLMCNITSGPKIGGRSAESYYISGDYERSLDWLERAIEERNFRTVQINQDPLFSDPVFRSNPRFQAILKKMNFPDI